MIGEALAEQAGFGLLEYGIAGIFIFTLLLGIVWIVRTTAKERAAIEERDNTRETALRATVSKAFDERHEDAVRIERRLSRIEAKLGVKDRNGCD